MSADANTYLFDEIDSLKEFYLEFFPVISVFAQRYVKDEDVAKDIAQEAFISLWEKKPDVESIENMRFYLYTVTRNKCLNHINHQKVRQNHSDFVLQDNDDHYFDTHMVEQEVFIQLKQAIDQLAPQTQKIISMSLEGMGNIEISEQMGISVNTIKTLKSRAFKKLKSELKEHFYLFFL